MSAGKAAFWGKKAALQKNVKKNKKVEKKC